MLVLLVAEVLVGGVDAVDSEIFDLSAVVVDVCLLKLESFFDFLNPGIPGLFKADTCVRLIVLVAVVFDVGFGDSS